MKGSPLEKGTKIKSKTLNWWIIRLCLLSNNYPGQEMENEDFHSVNKALMFLHPESFMFTLSIRVCTDLYSDIFVENSNNLTNLSLTDIMRSFSC